MSKMNTGFYKSTHIRTASDLVVDNYIKGDYYDKKTGKRIKIEGGPNKYNKDFLMQLSDVNIQFFSLLRADSIVVKLLKMHEHKSGGEVYSISNLMRAQGGTIRYNRILKSALKTYGIKKQEIYNAIKKNIDSEKERVSRNKVLLYNLLDDYGLGSLNELIQKGTGRDLVDDILYFVNNNDVNTDFKSQKDDAELRKAEIDEYYENVDNQYIDHLLDIAKANNINLFSEISESLKDVHELRDKQAKARKEQQRQAKLLERKKIAEAYINNDNGLLSDAMNSYKTTLYYENYKETCKVRVNDRLNLRDALALRAKVSKLNGIAYYISVCKESMVQYVSATGNLTRSILNARAVADKENLSKLHSDALEKYRDYMVKVCILRITNGELCNTLEGPLEQTVHDQLNNNSPYIAARILKEALLVELLAGNQIVEYNPIQTITVIVKYKDTLTNGLDIQYMILGDKKDVNKTLHYIDCNGTPRTEEITFGLDIKKLVILISKENGLTQIDREAICSATKSGYKLMLIKHTFDLTEHLNKFINTRKQEMSAFYSLLNYSETPASLDIEYRDHSLMYYFKTESSIISIRNRLLELQNQGYRQAYIIMGSSNINRGDYLKNQTKYICMESKNKQNIKSRTLADTNLIILVDNQSVLHNILSTLNTFKDNGFLYEIVSIDLDLLVKEYNQEIHIRKF